MTDPLSTPLTEAHAAQLRELAQRPEVIEQMLNMPETLTFDELLAELSAPPILEAQEPDIVIPVVRRVAKVRMLWHPVSGRWVFEKPEGVSTYIETKPKRRP